MARRPNEGPASDPELLILSSLTTGPKHGYAIMTDVRVMANVTLGPGTLYTAISRLVESGWITACEEKGRQRPYKLTGSGKDHLCDQLNKLRALSAVALRRLRAHE
ncbi:PadR family transcriptional regulator [Granulicella aggregans]|uniref:PadR family transcriptional regulator n=1 Tax=Granulicella aggregans TaxID=474949 RepID=UPI00161E67F1